MTHQYNITFEINDNISYHIWHLIIDIILHLFYLSGQIALTGSTFAICGHWQKYSISGTPFACFTCWALGS